MQNRRNPRILRDMKNQLTWGVVATIKAPTRDILNFAAYHLDLGAHRVHIYLDEDTETARHALKAHPKCRVILCDDGYWKRRRRRKGRPPAHQPRQSINATHCLSRRPQVDWLAHIDVDEYLWPETPLPDQLATLPPDTISARVRPIEALADDPANPPADGTQWFKACTRMTSTRMDQTQAIYPTFGEHLNGGFLSHVVGKVFVRTETENLSLRIHNAFINGEKDAAPRELPHTSLCHLHADTYDKWRHHYRYRLDQGSYRVGLKSAPGAVNPNINQHALLKQIEEDGGADGLRAFFTEVCTATPQLRTRLAEHGHLRQIALDLDGKRARHFPDFA